MGRWIDEYVDGWMDVWMNGQLEGWVDEWMDGWRKGWMSEWMDEQVDGWVGEWVVGWMEEKEQYLHVLQSKWLQQPQNSHYCFHSYVTF